MKASWKKTLSIRVELTVVKKNKERETHMEKFSLRDKEKIT